MTTNSAPVQATVVAIDGRGVLLHGDAGVGKSDLTLRLIDTGATLVADDLVLVEPQGPWLTAIAPPHQHGRLFVSGIGVVTMPRHQPYARLSLAVHCLPIPPVGHRGATLGLWRCHGLALPEIALVAHLASAPNQLRLALDRWGL